MERWQSTWENNVEYNLSESGVHPLTIREVMEGHAPEILDKSLGYGQTNGTIELRKRIAAIYEDADQDNILVTNGSSEANFVALWRLLQDRGEVAFMIPNYMQICGLANNLGAKVKTFRLIESRNEWIPDFSALSRIVNKKTKVIAICNPNNPTGATLNEKHLEEICGIARKVNAWILSDEVYQGSEINGKTTPSIWNYHDKALAISGLSKAYGLPGLRIGWVTTKKQMATKLWSNHDYTSIAPNVVSDYVATKVMEPDTRNRILTRTRSILKQNLPMVAEWINRNDEHFRFIPPKAGAIAYLKYNLKINSKQFANRLLQEKKTLVVPGAHFGMDRYLRIGYGSPADYLSAGLKRIDELVNEINR
ncbi:MAG TPA: aminotransferase class I/II-fold pyridoxal phosphate-dependent enzyme [Candidatus Acidoferrum sp.]|nr:aminotransferase class I/II-fold pyridoxal phosphate-dependent enzyme [Candidatus Acidoferrum sp.]